MHRNCMRQGMMVGILCQNGKHLHTRWLRFPTTVQDSPFQSPFTVGGVFAALSFRVGVAGQMQFKVPQ